jgi:hypothetical protein
MYDAFRKIIKYEGVKGLYKVGTKISVYNTVVNKPLSSPRNADRFSSDKVFILYTFFFSSQFVVFGTGG